MVLGLLVRQLTTLHHQLHKRVIHGDAVRPEMIGPAVADVHDLHAQAADEGSHERRAHAAELLAELRMLIDGDIGQLRRRTQHVLLLRLGHPIAQRAADLAAEDLAGKAAGYIPGACAAHAVAHDGEQRLRAKALHAVKVLIFLTHVSRVRQSPCFHPFRSLLLVFPPRNFCGAGRRRR